MITRLMRQQRSFRRIVIVHFLQIQFLLYSVQLSSHLAIIHCAPTTTLLVNSSPSSSSPSSLGLIAEEENRQRRIPVEEGRNFQTVQNAVVQSQVSNVTRQHEGDIFIAHGLSSCTIDTCVGLSSGTAGLFVSDTSKTASSGTPMFIATGSHQLQHPSKRRDNDGDPPICECRCFPYLNTYREDLGICVDDIHECTLSSFVSGSSSEKIPFVFLPLRGQIIYPSREISFPDVKTPICAVTGAQFLTTNGWSDLRNPIDADYPFRLFRDEGRTFLQWLGEPDLRYKMQGRLILVHLLCRDMSVVTTVQSNLGGNQKTIPVNTNVFSSCVAFRVNGSPVQYTHNVTEVLFQAESSSIESNTSEGLGAREYVVIGLCSLLLGLIYVASVFLYLHVKKKKAYASSASSNRRISGSTSNPHLRSSTSSERLPADFIKNDQVTFGTSFTRAGSLYSSTASATIHHGNGSGNGSNRNGERSYTNGNSSVKNSTMNHGEEMGIIKSNPLLKHYQNFSDNSGFVSDRSNSNSECGEECSNMKSSGALNERTKCVRELRTSAMVHLSSDNSSNQHNSNCNENGKVKNNTELSSSPTQEQECLPEENVSIVEDISNDENIENMKAIVNGTVRKKLYFNPAYFEPHLLLSPPPAAIEFLTKIREVIAIAKYKMASKRYQPSLNIIPEEGNYNESAIRSGSSNSKISNQTFNSTKNQDQSNDQRSVSNDANCSGCPGCSNRSKASTNVVQCNHCGDKRNSIQKWLENVQIENNSKVNKERSPSKSPSSKAPISKESQNQSLVQSENQMNGEQKSSLAGSSNTISPLSPEPRAVPKIVSHFLKTNKASQITHSAPTAVNSRSNHLKDIPKTSDLYDFAETGNEIYNNPKFVQHESPPPVLKNHSKTSSCVNGRQSRGSSKKRIEVLDQYANPSSFLYNKNHYESFKDINQMPDMVYEALAKDYSFRLLERNLIYNKIKSDLYTSDYEASGDKRSPACTQGGSDLSIPTPDYSTLSKRSTRQYQPDSPIFRRKSPPFLIVDYETDSLERVTTSKKSDNRGCANNNKSKKKKDHNSFSYSNNSSSSDSNSQPSPSLSSALPLEEEVEVRHTVYDKVEGHRKDGSEIIITPRSIPQNGRDDLKYAKGPRIKYDTPFRGSMTIEVEHEPQSDVELSTDSDQFEPDTLDRKPKKIQGNSFNDVDKSINAWSEHLEKSKNFVNGNDLCVSFFSLENMNSLPDFSTEQTHQQNVNDQFILRSSNSFRNYSKIGKEYSFPISRSEKDNREQEINENPLLKLSNKKETFGSLREIYQSKMGKDIRKMVETNSDLSSENGFLLSLEKKHSKRQRKIITDCTTTKVQPPDVVPTISQLNNDHYNRWKPKELKRDELSGHTTRKSPIQKNSKGWNTSNLNGSKFTEDGEVSSPNNVILSQSSSSSPTPQDDVTDATSIYSESTEVTGISDTQMTSDNDLSSNFHRKLPNEKVYTSSSFLKLQCSLNEFCNSQSNEISQADKSPTDPNIKKDLRKRYSFRNIFTKDSKPKDCLNSKQLTKSDSISTTTEDSNNHTLLSSLSPLINETNNKENNIQAVFHVQVSSSPQISNGMQIAMGLRDKTKKSTELRTAWRKLINIATSKFHTKSVDDILHNDQSDSASFKNVPENTTEAISKTEHFLPPFLPNKSNLKRSSSFYYDVKHSPEHNSISQLQRSEMDSGYMSSADSSEIYNRRYEGYNFEFTTTAASTPETSTTSYATAALLIPEENAAITENTTQEWEPSTKMLENRKNNVSYEICKSVAKENISYLTGNNCRNNQNTENGINTDHKEENIQLPDTGEEAGKISEKFLPPTCETSLREDIKTISIEMTVKDDQKLYSNKKNHLPQHTDVNIHNDDGDDDDDDGCCKNKTLFETSNSNLKFNEEISNAITMIRNNPHSNYCSASNNESTTDTNTTNSLTESDEDDDGLCESGAESIETHSVLYKKYKKSSC